MPASRKGKGSHALRRSTHHQKTGKYVRQYKRTWNNKFAAYIRNPSVRPKARASKGAKKEVVMRAYR